MHHHPYPTTYVTTATGVAACAVVLPRASGALQIFPAGEFRASQGALMGAGPWRCTAAAAQRVVRKAIARGIKIAIDYGHQTLLQEKNGQPAPAAGWIDPNRLVWEEQRGLIDPAPEWTERAAAGIEAGEWLYGSPVFRYDSTTGEVLELLHFAITNTPAIDGFRPIGAAAFNPNGGSPVDNDLRERLLKLLDLPADTADADIIANLDRLLSDMGSVGATSLPALKRAYTTLQGELAQTRTAAAAAAPVALVQQLQGEIAALRADATRREVEELVESGLADGRILPSMEAWARGLAATSTQALRDYLNTAAPIAALVATQTSGLAPAGASGKAALNDGELAVCKAMGLSTDEFLAARDGEKKGE